MRGHAVVAEASWTAHGPGGSLHLDLAARLMADHGLTPDLLAAVVVATGPGSFTGIRAGVSVGHGLAEALSIPLIGVPTLSGLVAQMSGHACAGDIACAIISAGRGAIHAWSAVIGNGPAESCGEPVTATVQEVAAALAIIGTATSRRVVVGGEVDAEQARLFLASVPSCFVLSPTVTQRRAAWLAELARPMLAAMHADPSLWGGAAGGHVTHFPEDVQPLYVVPHIGTRPPDLGWRVPLG